MKISVWMRSQIFLFCLLLLFLCGCGQAADTSGLCGSYRIVRSESDKLVLPDDITDSFDLCLRLDPGGSGEVYNSENRGRLRWQLESDTLTVWIGSRTLTGSVEGTSLLLYDNESGALLRFDMLDENSEAENDSAEPEKESLSAWVGDWYGWWKIEDSAQNMPMSWYDCCASITREGSCLRLSLWDEDGSYSEPLSSVLFTEDADGVLNSVSGYFYGRTIQEHDWTLALTDGALFLDRQHYQQNGEDFLFSVYLRPWGDDWKGLDPDQFPFYYDDWYLPLVENKAPMPEQIPWQELEQNRENPKAS